MSQGWVEAGVQTPRDRIKGSPVSGSALRRSLLGSSTLVSAWIVGGLVAASSMAVMSPARANGGDCDVTGTTTVVTCNSTSASVTMTPGIGSLTVTDLTTQSIIYGSPLTPGTYDQTVLITGTTVVNNPSYSGLVMQFGTDQSTPPNRIDVIVNADVTVGAGVQMTSIGGFGTVWVRNDNAGQIVIRNSGTLNGTSSSTNDGNGTINATTNLGSVTVVNSGSVTSHNDRGIYADGNSRGATDGVMETVSVTNTATGVVNAHTAGIRVIDYYGTASITNEGTVDARLRQGLVAWSADGDTTISNSGRVTSGNDNAIQAMTEIGDVTVTNSGSATAEGDPTLDIAHAALATPAGYNGLRATAYTSGAITITNTLTGVVTANRDSGILAETPIGDVSIINAGTITARTGIVANSGFATGMTDATVPTTNGTITVQNTGMVTATDLAVALDGTTNVLTNAGTLSTMGAIAVQTGNGNTTITNTGTISSGSASGTAISMGAGQNQLVISDTSVIVGNVTNVSTSNVLELTGTGSGMLDLETVSATGAFQGFSTLVKSGAGTWTLTGSGGSLAGTFTVNGGTLQIGNGGTTGSIANDVAVASGATLAFNRADTVTYANVISGAGALVKDGAGLLILTGENTYTGGTTIAEGTLQIGNGGTTGSVMGDIVNNAALIFNRSDTYDFPGSITGTGTVTIIGGTVNFTGSGGYSGPITVETSDLVLAPGSSSGSTFNVGAGGTIGGSGTIGGLVVGSGGTAAPGYSPGTITVNGNVSFAAARPMRSRCGPTARMTSSPLPARRPCRAARSRCWRRRATTTRSPPTPSSARRPASPGSSRASCRTMPSSAPR